MLHLMHKTGGQSTDYLDILHIQWIVFHFGCEEHYRPTHWSFTADTAFFHDYLILLVHGVHGVLPSLEKTANFLPLTELHSPMFQPSMHIHLHIHG